MNLSVDANKWFAYYKGFVYANKPTPIHARISNKALIETNQFTLPTDFDNCVCGELKSIENEVCELCLVALYKRPKARTTQKAFSGKGKR